MVHNVGYTTRVPNKSEVIPPSYGLRNVEASGLGNKRVTENERSQECVG
jgi:hypothetical protein